MADATEPPAAPGGPGGGSKKHLRRGTACLCCKTQRLNCDGAIPCQRCVRLGKKCEPQPPLSRRRRHGQQALTEAEMVAEGAAGAAAYLTVQRGAMTRLFDQMNPRELADMVCRLYINKVRDGSIGRRSAVWSLRNWLRKCWVCGSDASWGIIDAVMTEMGLTHLDLEQEAAELELDYPMEQLRRQAAEDMKQAQSLVPKVQASSDFQQADTAAAGVYMGCFIGESGRIYVPAVNRVFNSFFRNNAEHFSDLISYRTLNYLLAGALMAPEDREVFFDLMLDVSLGNKPLRGSQLVKIRQRDGEVRLYIFRCHRLRVLPDGTPISFVMRFEPAPPSRHLEPAALAATRPRPPAQPIPQHQQLAAAGPVPGVAVLPIPVVGELDPQWLMQASPPQLLFEQPPPAPPSAAAPSQQQQQDAEGEAGRLGLSLLSLSPTSAAARPAPSAPPPPFDPWAPPSLLPTAVSVAGDDGGRALPSPLVIGLAGGEAAAGPLPPPTFDAALLHEIFADGGVDGGCEEAAAQGQGGGFEDADGRGLAGR